MKEEQPDTWPGVAVTAITGVVIVALVALCLGWRPWA